MENTSSSEINIPKSHIIVVKEAPEQPNQEDLENKTPENTSNVEECRPEQEFEELSKHMTCS